MPAAQYLGRHASVVVEAVAASWPFLARMAVSEKEISGRPGSSHLLGLLGFENIPMDYLPGRQCPHCGKLAWDESSHVDEPSRPAHL